MTSVQEALSRAMQAIAQDLKNELRQVSPVKTGNLKRSISVVETSEGLLITMADYGKFVEFGVPPKQSPPPYEFNYGHRPNPFIRKTFHEKFGKIIVTRIQEELDA